MDEEKRLERNRKNRLRYWTKKLGPKLGAGFWEGEEGWPNKNEEQYNDSRYPFDDEEIKNVLKLLDLGATKVNFKD